MNENILEAENLKKHFPVQKRLFGGESLFARAVDGVSFSIRKGETLGLVGESGCGKSTVARLLARLEKPTAGKITVAGQEITHLSPKDMIPHRLQVQMVFQDSVSSLNPRMTAGNLVAEAFHIHKLAPSSEINERVLELFDKVGLNAELQSRYPHELSGGQCQRLSIARALAVNPSLIIADEAVSALDVSIQAQVVNLLRELQERLKLAYLFISHDLAVVSLISHRVAVMYLGQFVEIGTTEAVIKEAMHPYTRALLLASPIPNARPRQNKSGLIKGELPSPINPPDGCRFNPRCPFATSECKTKQPHLREMRPGHFVACHHASKF